jgi:hypothetical protein
MHPFSELAYRAAVHSLGNIQAAHANVEEQLQTSGATILVKGLQALQLQKSILAVGMVSMFEAELQDSFSNTDGFKKADEILRSSGEDQLLERFILFRLAINVLKHGRGRSYDALVEKADLLPFRIKKPGDSFFNEGDVAEIGTLVEADDEFVLACAELIESVSKAMKAFHRKR